jgi:D-alanine-D-alanine ligase
MKVVLLHTADALEPPIDPVIEQLSGALRTLGHETESMVVDREVDALAGALRRHAPDLVFNLAESFRGKSALESNVAALLNLIDYRYTGSSPAGLFLAGDKSLTKKVLRFHGIQTPEFATLYRGAVDWAGDLTFPVIVKPPQEDASLGITSASVVREIKDLFARIDELQSEYQTPVLVEQFIEGREFYVGVLGNANPEALPVIELDFSASRAGTRSGGRTERVRAPSSRERSPSSRAICRTSWSTECGPSPSRHSTRCGFAITRGSIFACRRRRRST